LTKQAKRVLPVRNIIFDLGGVLLRWDVDWIITQVFSEPRKCELVRREIFQHPDWNELDRGSLTKEQAIRHFVERTALPVSDIRKVMEAVKRCLTPLPESMELLDRLKTEGFQLYCLSNMHRASFAFIRDRFDFWSKLKGILISAYVGRVKPEPDIFEYFLERFRLNREQTVFVDDHKPNVEASQELGIRSVLFTSAAECERQIHLLARERQATGDRRKTP